MVLQKELVPVYNEWVVIKKIDLGWKLLKNILYPFICFYNLHKNTKYLTLFHLLYINIIFLVIIIEQFGMFDYNYIYF